MASPTLSAQTIQQNFLQCSVCKNQFQDPRTLPCQHNVCCRCLEGIFQTHPTQSSLKCPLCRKRVAIPAEGINGFPRSLILNQLLDAVNEARPVSDVPKVTTEVSERDFGEVVKIHGPDELDKLYLELGIEKNDIDRAKRQANTKHVGLQGREVLRSWYQEKAQLATRRAILEASQRCGFKKAVKKLREIWPNEEFDAHVVPTHDFILVVKALRPDDLHTLFLQLNITQREIDIAEISADTPDKELQAIAVLWWWLQNRGEAEASRRAILVAMKECGFTPAIAYLQPFWPDEFATAEAEPP